MKIVINGCYGGFGLSKLAIQEYLKLKGKKAYFYKYEKGNFRKLKEKESAWSSVLTLTKDYGDVIKGKYKNEDYFYYGAIERDDPDLVKVVEKLKEKVDENFSKLKVVEIPDNIQYVINDYDGMESIHEEHESWS